jgi:hypothetical protein
MSGYPIYDDDDEMDNNYESDYDFASTSNSRFKKYFADKQDGNFFADR